MTVDSVEELKLSGHSRLSSARVLKAPMKSAAAMVKGSFSTISVSSETDAGPYSVRQSALVSNSVLSGNAELASNSVSDSRKWMALERTQRIVGNSKFLRRLTVGLFARLELLILAGHKSRATLNKIRRCRSRAESLLSGNEAFLLHSLAAAQCGLDAAMAELGVYQGSSAQLICEAKKDRPLYLFDTFAGMPRPDGSDRSIFSHGQFAASLPAVRGLLSTYQNVCFFPGLFPQSAVSISDVRFSLVHLDADLYSSTLAGLEFFYPRMISGGIIIAHDYSILPGVSRAFADFFKLKPEALIELPSTQAMIIARN